MIRRTDLMNTETLDPRYRDLDLWPTQLAVEAMLEGQMAAIAALQSQTAAIAAAAEQAAQRLGTDGRLVFVGAGTSGRLAVQDGTELYPTFGWTMERMVFLMAGGSGALTQARKAPRTMRRPPAPKSLPPTSARMMW
jgi:N-acetylmuramic acid 6-phosphate etherase